MATGSSGRPCLVFSVALLAAMVRKLALLPVLTLVALVAIAAPAAAQTWFPLAPTVNYQPTGVRDPATGRLILYGRNLSGVNEVWVLTNADGLGGTPTWTQSLPSGGPPPNRGNPAVARTYACPRHVSSRGIGATLLSFNAAQWIGHGECV